MGARAAAKQDCYLASIQNGAIWQEEKKFQLVPFQLVALNFGEPRGLPAAAGKPACAGRPLFEVAPSSPRLQVTFTPACVVGAQTTLIVDQSQRASIGGGTHLSLVVLLQAFSQIARAADVEFSIPVAQQNLGVFHRSSQQFGSKSWNGTSRPASLKTQSPPSTGGRMYAAPCRKSPAEGIA